MTNLFRKAVVNFKGGCPLAGHPDNTRDSLPVVTLIQRKGGKTHLGNRTISNIEEIDRMLKSKKDKLIYDGYKYFDNIPLMEQACMVANTDIFISIHGNALGWAVMLPPRSVAIELCARWLCYISAFRNLGHKKYHLTCNSTNDPDLKQIENMVEESVRYIMNKKINP